ncbi:MAG: response regulator [Erysipelotrichaceae bacterium]|nr:response regulator [Erysipelotrichaceae bacterium]MBR2700469.1 response regulator [Erysipelotrichaceae bacterium]
MSDIKVVVADDEILALNGISNLIDKTEGFKVVGKASNGRECLELIREKSPELVITDIKMPVMDGLTMIEQCVRQNLGVSIIVISAYDDRDYLRAAIRCPLVYDYLFKPFRNEEFFAALQGASGFHKKYAVEHNDESGMALLVSNIFNNDFPSIEKYLGEFFSQDVSLQEMKNQCYGWIMYVHNAVFADNKTRSFDSRRTMNKVFEAKGKEELQEVISRYLRGCCDRFVLNDNVTVLVKSCLRIMQREYDNADLNLNYCANKLDVTPSYLSGRFSRDMNQSFSVYLNNLRIDKAREMLKNVSLKVYEIAERVGIADVSYFNKLFRDYEGKTPLQYRREIMESDFENENEDR